MSQEKKKKPTEREKRTKLNRNLKKKILDFLKCIFKG